jgi:hypothetical protein
MSSLTASIDWAAEDPANRPAHGVLNPGPIRYGDRVEVHKTMYQQIVALRQEDPGVAEAFDLLVVELSKLFEKWKGRGKGFVFGRPEHSNGVVIELNLSRYFWVRVADSEVSRKIADQLSENRDNGRLWHRHKIATVEDSVWFSRLLGTELQPWNNAFPQEESGSPKQVFPQPVIGRPYVDVDENVEITPPDSFNVDPSKLERGWKGHQVTQNRLAAHVRSVGAIPLQPEGKPVYDLGWKLGEQVFVAEIKSVTDANEEGQMRLGLGQVLHYAHQLSKKLGGFKVVPVLVPEREPSDPEWKKLCTELGVILTWPADFHISIGAAAAQNSSDAIRK